MLIIARFISLMVQNDFSTLIVSLVLQPSAGYDLITRGLVITHNDAPQSVGILWTSDHLVAYTST
jgi:hypothetical protein